MMEVVVVVAWRHVQRPSGSSRCCCCCGVASRLQKCTESTANQCSCLSSFFLRFASRWIDCLAPDELSCPLAPARLFASSIITGYLEVDRQAGGRANSHSVTSDGNQATEQILCHRLLFVCMLPIISRYVSIVTRLTTTTTTMIICCCTIIIIGGLLLPATVRVCTIHGAEQ
ncbi:uncharacterized protein J3D65DRAFT_259179 [Phyllosticta citribraziliensis]|uniref:Secreted protein n=1 Tax=Phyllosticta citribraziliensis TaxID=989973 RepID=A0ABR1M1Z2_9PEZI